MTENQVVYRGVEAAQVLDNPAYVEAIALLKKTVSDQLLDCPIRDKEGMVLLLQLSKLTVKFEGILGGMVGAGKYAQVKIDLDRERNESKAQKFMRRTLG